MNYIPKYMTTLQNIIKELEEGSYMGKKFKDMSRREILEAFEKHDKLYRQELKDNQK